MRELIEGSKRLSFDEINRLMLQKTINPEEVNIISEKESIMEESASETSGESHYYWEYYEE